MTETVIEQIKARSLPLMETFQSDLEHDSDWLNRLPAAGFIHITTNSSTHIFGIPDGFGKNERVPYLFGHSTAREIARGELAVIHSMNKAGAFFQYCPAPRYRDGIRYVAEITGRTAAIKFTEGYEKACARLQARGSW